MRSLAPFSFSRPWIATGLGVALLALGGCPGAEVPTITGSESSGPGPTTSPTTGPIDPTTGGGVTTTPADSGSTSNPGTSTTAMTTAMTTAATTDPSTSGASTDMGTTGMGTTGMGSTGMGSSESSGGSSGGAFIPVFDIGPAIECDLWLQDCPVGNKCMPWDSGGGTWDATMCSPVDPMPVPTDGVCEVVGSATSGIDNCELGSMCWDVDGMTLEGTCVEMCTGTPMAPNCAPAGTNCVIANGGLLILCLPGCDPILQDCGAGQACYPISGGYTCAPDASGAGGFDNDTCEFINVCDPGLMCLDAMAVDGCGGVVGCCAPFCEISMGDTCPGPEECVAVYPMPPLGYEDVGVCALP